MVQVNVSPLYLWSVPRKNVDDDDRFMITPAGPFYINITKYSLCDEIQIG